MWYLVMNNIIITNLFPIHKNQSSFYNILNTNIQTNIIINTFLFTLTSTKKKYPYLLPKINLNNLILNTYSNNNITTQTLINFKTYQTNYKNKNIITKPQLITIYINTNSINISNQIQNTLQKYNKSSFTINHKTSTINNNITSKFYSTYSKTKIQTIFKILNKTQ